MVVVSLESTPETAHPNRADNTSAVLHRDLGVELFALERGEGNHLVLEDGRKIFDASGGPAVASIGWGNKRVIEAVYKQMLEMPYCATIFYTTKVQEELCRLLVDSTHGHMARAYIVNSGSEAMEAAMKLARQYFLELKPPQTQRTRFISRRQSYHGITLGALAVGGHQGRREKFEPLLINTVSQVSPCNEYRGKMPGETNEKYVARLANELDQEFQRVGPDSVCAFVAEPIVGAAQGCVAAVPGYFKAVAAVCKKYGALLILDEVMCGMGRSGTLHAWEQEGVVPDIQTIGKALGGGYQPIAGLLINHTVINCLKSGTGSFVHGHTYQGHPAGCAAALEVQRIIQEEGLVANVRAMGTLLSEGLEKRIGNHPNVGNIRGRGLFWGIEFVANKKTLAPFPGKLHVAMKLSGLGLGSKYNVQVYPGAGSADGIEGDHVIISPAFNIQSHEIKWLVDTIGRLVDDFFADLKV
ncbi:putative aminotransferase [Cladorrhinum sp. PSN332]|nr:putative aminotransferase [Cladorrhinum sp. PSN332]